MILKQRMDWNGFYYIYHLYNILLPSVTRLSHIWAVSQLLQCIHWMCDRAACNINTGYIPYSKFFKHCYSSRSMIQNIRPIFLYDNYKKTHKGYMPKDHTCLHNLKKYLVIKGPKRRNSFSNLSNPLKWMTSALQILWVKF